MADPKLIDGAWWAQQPDGSWLRFDNGAQQWVASGPPQAAEVIEPAATVDTASAQSAGPAGSRAAGAAWPQSGTPAYPATPAASAPRGSFGQAPIVVWLVLGAAVLVMIGSIGPWATVLFITVNGLDGDGAFTVFLGLGAGVLAVVRASGQGVWTLIVAAVCFALSSLTGIIDWADLESVAGSSGLIEVGWGLVLMTIASIAGFVLSIVAMRARPRAVLA